MPDYMKMYLRLFNAITDALEAMGCDNYGIAQEILKKAQAEAEELYLSAE